MKCLLCGKEKAIKHPLYGFLPGLNCQKKQRSYQKVGITAEITTSQIKEDRKKYKTDLTQPFRGGELSKEYVEAYPDRVKEMVKEKHVTESELKNAKNIWDLDYYKKE